MTIVGLSNILLAPFGLILDCSDSSETEDGDVFTWGKNRFGQLGHPLDRDPAVGDPFLVAEPRKVRAQKKKCFLLSDDVSSILLFLSSLRVLHIFLVSFSLSLYMRSQVYPCLV